MKTLLHILQIQINYYWKDTNENCKKVTGKNARRNVKETQEEGEVLE